VDEIVRRLSLVPDGDRVLAQAIPHTGAALRRLAQIYFDVWRFADARATWTAALRLDGATPVWPSGGEALLDGEFNQDEHRLLYHWIVESMAGVNLERKTEGGESFLAADFAHGPDNWFHVTQAVPVEPGRRYRLTARVRVKGFAPDDLFGVEAVHPYAAELFAARAVCLAGPAEPSRAVSPYPVSNGSFVTVHVDLTVPEGLHLLSVRLRRWAPNSGAGRVDFTGVSLRRLEN
jgi:hypothetical protein